MEFLISYTILPGPSLLLSLFEIPDLVTKCNFDEESGISLLSFPQKRILVILFYSKKREHSKVHLRHYFAQYSSEYETSDKDQKVNRNI